MSVTEAEHYITQKISVYCRPVILLSGLCFVDSDSYHWCLLGTSNLVSNGTVT